MAIRLGVIEYSRPTNPVGFDDVRHTLAMCGKDVIRLAWTSLNPDEDNDIKTNALKRWLVEFFNLKSYSDGSNCASLLYELNLLKNGRYNYSDYFGPTFEL